MSFFSLHHGLAFCEEKRSDLSTDLRCVCKGRKLKTKCLTSVHVTWVVHTSYTPPCPFQTHRNTEACTHATCYFETQKPGSKTDNARKYRLAWSTIPAAVHENLLPTCIHQMTPTTAHIQTFPQTHTGMHIYAYTPKDTSSFPWCPIFALKTRQSLAKCSTPTAPAAVCWFHTLWLPTPALCCTSLCGCSRLVAQSLVWCKYLHALWEEHSALASRGRLSAYLFWNSKQRGEQRREKAR